MSKLKQPPAKIAAAVLGGILGVSLTLAFPLLPIWALALLGLPVTLTLQSYLGSVLLIVFLSATFRISQTQIKALKIDSHAD